MLADSIEAAARSLDEPTPVRLQNIVHNVIQRKFLDGQLDECNLTLKDLSKVEGGILHQSCWGFIINVLIIRAVQVVV